MLYTPKETPPKILACFLMSISLQFINGSKNSPSQSARVLFSTEGISCKQVDMLAMIRKANCCLEITIKKAQIK